jgi:hypothetical protein
LLLSKKDTIKVLYCIIGLLEEFQNTKVRPRGTRLKGYGLGVDEGGFCGSWSHAPDPGLSEKLAIVYYRERNITLKSSYMI